MQASCTYLGLARTVYIPFMTVYMVISLPTIQLYTVYIGFWLTLHIFKSLAKTDDKSL